MMWLSLPQELAATTFALIYLAFFRLRCRYHAEQGMNRAGRLVENPGTLFANRSEKNIRRQMADLVGLTGGMQ